MFERLQSGLFEAIRTLAGQGKLTEANMREGLRMVQQALLEADVSLPVVKAFIEKVSKEALGERVLRSLRPTQQLLTIVYEQLVALMGPVDHDLHLKPSGSIIMLCGLQGSGKTTTAAKLGKYLQMKGWKPLLVAADLQRPAAIEQLQVLGEKIGAAVYVEKGATDPLLVCRNALRQMSELGANVAVLDTAGRLHIDQALMQQLALIDRQIQPDQVYLVVDAMTGQDAVNSAKAFHEALKLNGVILTKLDGDARGGAALSVKFVTGVPIKFIGTGESTEALEEFHPERIAGRILGQGDLMTLIEQARQKVDQEAMRRQQERLQQGQFTFDDFRNLIDQMSRLGPVNQIMSMIPGMGRLVDEMGDLDAEHSLRRIRGIIDAMTPEERRKPEIIDLSRRRRIAAGAGVAPHDVSELVRVFEPIAEMMRQLAGQGMRGRVQMIQSLMRQAASNPQGMLSKPKVGTGKRLRPEEKARLKKLREKELRRRRKEQRRGG